MTDTDLLERPRVEAAKAKPKPMTPEEFDEYFDNGGDISPYLDLSTARRPNREKGVARVNLDLPTWAIERLDHEADRIGISRQSLMKMWLVTRLDQIAEDARG